LKDIDWEPIAEKALDVIRSTNADDLDELTPEDRLVYQACILDMSKLTLLHMMATPEEKERIEMEMNFVRLSMESLEARNALFAYRKTVEVIGAVLAATIAVALAVA